MNVFLMVFLVVLLSQGALCAGLMFWKQSRRSGTPSYVFVEKPKVTVGSSLFQKVNEFCLRTRYYKHLAASCNRLMAT